MTTGRMTKMLQHLRGVDARLTDGQLLGCFISRRDEAAFAALVRRHGPMVWGVCRRVLRNSHDAEDAFQATFLVLVKKAASIQRRTLLANYLYGVAHRTALKARAVAARRRTHEKQVFPVPEPAAPSSAVTDIEPLLDEELSRLPDKYRVPIVLCDLQGKTRKEAAHLLGWPEGTVAGRLARGRALLAKRLTRRGVTLSGAAPALVPTNLVSTTVKAASLVASGTGILSTEVASLTEGVMQAMFVTKLKAALGACLVVGLLVLGSAFGYRTVAADKAPAAPAVKKNELRDTLLLLDNQWWEALSKNDVDTLGKILADDWVGYDQAGQHWNRVKSLELYRDTRIRDVKFLSEREVFRIDAHTAVMIYEVKARGESRAGPSSYHQRNMYIWVQRDGGWFVKFSQCTPLPETDPSAKLSNRTPWEYELLPDLGKGPQVAPWPPGITPYPSLVPSGPITIPPGTVDLAPYKELKAFVVPPDPLNANPPTIKKAAEPKGTSKGPGNPNADQDEGLSWGKVVGGLQVGLGLTVRKQQVYEMGEAIPLTMKVRNVGERPVAIKYVQGFQGTFLVAADAAGKPVEVIRPRQEAGFQSPPPREVAPPFERTLKPGESMDLLGAMVCFQLPKASDRAKSFANVLALPGKYQIGYAGFVISEAVPAEGTPSQVERLFSIPPQLSTGTVDVEIKAATKPE